MYSEDIEKIVMDNGSLLWVCRRPSEDVSVDVAVAAGEVHGIHKVHFREHLILESTPLRSSGEIARAIERDCVSDYQAETYPTMMRFHLLPQKEHAAAAMRLFFETYSNKDFAPRDIEMERGAILGERLKRRSQPFYKMERKIRSEVLLGHPLDTPEETEEGLLAVDAKILAATAEMCFGSFSSIALAGGVDDKTIDAIRSTFGRLPRNGNGAVRFPPQQGRYHEETGEGSEETGYVIVAMPIPGVEHPYFHSIELLAHILGGNRGADRFSNRLYERVRRKGGIVYDQRLSIEWHNGVGILYAEASGIRKGDVAAVKEMMVDEFGNLGESIGKEELDGCKRTIIAAERRRYHDNIEGWSEKTAWVGLHGLQPELDYFAREINALEPAGLKEVARRTISNCNYCIGMVV